MRAPRKKVVQRGRACATCGQHVMPFELRGHGAACVYCLPSVPDAITGEAMLASEHKLALDEDRRRRRDARAEDGGPSGEQDAP